MKNQFGKFMRSVASIALLFPAVASAQDAAEADAPSDIIVTAQKRQERTIDVPVALTVLGSEDISKLGLTESSQLAQQTPGLSWGGTSGNSMPNIFLRGVGNLDFQSGSNSPIGTYVDGVYQGNSFGVAGLLMDLKRVEVLRGPQGTLWGKNTTGGIINYVPNLAEVGAATNGHVQLGYGNYDNVNVDAAVGGPLTDSLAARVAVQYNRRDGFFTSVDPATKGNIGGFEWFGARGSLAARVSDTLTATLSFSYSKLDGQTSPVKSLGLFDPAQPGAYAPCPLPRAGQLGTGCADAVGYVSSPDAFTIAPTSIPLERVETYSPTLKLDWELGGVNLASITSYNNSKRSVFSDSDYTPSDIYEYNAQDRFNSFSQEIRLSSSQTQPLSWIVGAYYYRDELNLYQAFNLPIFGNPVGAVNIQNDSENYAGFADATYAINDTISVRAGLRLTHDTREASGLAFQFNAVSGAFNPRDEALANLVGIGGDFSAGAKRSDTNLSGRAGLDFHLSRDALIYLNYSRGFKGGDTNSGANTIEQFGITRPEHLTSYEAGIKMAIPASGVQFDLAGYYYDYKDAQVYAVVPVENNQVSMLTNAGKLRIYGVDGNVSYSPSSHFNATLGFAYIDAKYLSYNSPMAGEDYTGNVPPFVSKLQLNGRAEYTVPLANGGDVELQADGVFRTKAYFTSAEDPLLSQGGYALLNSSIAYNLPDGRTSVRAWVKNLADKRYMKSGYSLTFVGVYFLFPGDPRTFGLSVRHTF